MGCGGSKDATVSDNQTSQKPMANVKEEQLKLAFKAKRLNVFNKSVEPEVRRTFRAQKIPKTPEQESIIRKFLFISFTIYYIV